MSKLNMKRVIFLFCLACLSVAKLWATDYSALGMGELVECTEKIFVVKLVTEGDQLQLKFFEALKGDGVKNFSLTSKLHVFQKDGPERHTAFFDGDARVNLDEVPTSDQRIIFLTSERGGSLRTFHPACIQPIEKKDLVLKVMAMSRDPGVFVKSPGSDDDVDLIYVLGQRFQAIHVSAPLLPALESYFSRVTRYDSMDVRGLSWQHTRFTMQFAWRPAQKPMLQMEPIEANGRLPDFIRRIDAQVGWDQWVPPNKEMLPPKFEVTVDTRGPARVGNLTFEEAADFLRRQLRSNKLEVVAMAYRSLSGLWDLDAVPIAIQMLRHQERKFRAEAAKFLAGAQDARAVDELCMALDELPPCIRYAAEGYNADDERVSSEVGRAVLNLEDVRTVPALKRAALKGYAGDWIAMALSQMGDEKAFEPLLSHLRNPKVDHYPSELVTMIQRSNLPVEAWMNKGLSSDDRQGKQDRAAKWIAWWEANKASFRIVRTWREAQKVPAP
ncbi:MAG: hypothetical protein K9N47_15760 [Prosthecobacter sp.]|uniref:HEAT repeat domain-containing protein n=1 Tax=Prosthecobacter sp. TaxID=1965333 RepID=UPI0025FC73B2|nr:hypothetical protein [Prosthecobacter sp.]MCF7787586.1 hypothetical protein [Prosthecobacter sp.]